MAKPRIAGRDTLGDEDTGEYPNWTLERNPYSIWVDTDGNQLPYIDKLSMSLGENLEVINLRVIAGEFDMQSRDIQPAKLPVLLENQEKGGYTVTINPMGNGSDYGFYLNLDYQLDEEVRKWFNNRDFRRGSHSASTASS